MSKKITSEHDHILILIIIYNYDCPLKSEIQMCYIIIYYLLKALEIATLEQERNIVKFEFYFYRNI